MAPVSLSRIVELVAGRYDGPDMDIHGVAPLGEAGPADLSFLANPKYGPLLEKTNAGAVLVAENHPGDSRKWVRVPNPYTALARVLAAFFSDRPHPVGISTHAAIAASARLGEGVAVGAFTSIGEGAVIGDGAVIYPNVTIEAGVQIGEGTVVYPQVSIYYGCVIGKRCVIHSGAVIGSDGFGFATEGGVHHKIPQIGIVRVGDDVEIGAGTTIDRAALGETVIGSGTKIDNLVQIGHNVVLGKGCLLVSQVGIAGSTELGDYVAVAGQSGFSGHLRIGNRVQVAAKSAVLADVPDDTKVMGIPAVPFREFARREAQLRKLGKKR
jgi:UDP-3-O-[3-hydroxymyristoyl] glucosamine N-acyltransferase